MSSHPSYRPDIDGLRAIAVLGVIAFHAFPESITAGFLGVDVFFVISGFLIGSIVFGDLQTDGRIHLGEFYARRIRRIFPALIIVLLAVLAFGWFALFADEYRQLGKHVFGGSIFISNFILLFENGYFDNASITKPLLHLWSLGVEIQFYLLFPVALIILDKMRLRPLWATLILWASSLVLDIILRHNYSSDAFYLPVCRFWELLSGSLMAYWHLHPIPQLRWSDRARNLSSLLGFALIAYGFFGKAYLSPGLPPVLGAVCLIAAGRDAWINRYILSRTAMIWIGLISYPLYLWHWPLLSYARIIESKIPAMEIRWILIAISFVLSWLTYEYIEKFVRKHPQRRELARYICLLLLGCGILGGIVYIEQGLPQRKILQGISDQQKSLLRSVSMDDVCTQFVQSVAKPFQYCRMRDVGGKETVAVIGDSHAHVVFDGMADLMAEQKINTLLLATGNCPPLLGAAPHTNPKTQTACAKQTEATLAVIEQHREIKRVLIVTRGISYITGTGFGEAEADMKDNYVEWLDGTKAEPEKVFITSLQHSIDQLNRTNHQVYYLLENPELGVDTALCIDRPLRFHKTSCTLSRATVEARQKIYRQSVHQLHHAVLIDPFPLLCDADECHVFADGNLLYADDDHFSLAGSRYLAEHWLKQYFSP